MRMRLILKLTIFLLSVAILCIPSSAQATLMDLGGGLIYDTDLDITWLQDVNYAGGQKSWDDAVAWAAGLVYGGYDDWRLPTADTSCGFATACTTSEMGHLYYTELGNLSGGGIPTTAPFINFPTDIFHMYAWTGQTRVDFPDYPWFYQWYNTGYQSSGLYKTTEAIAWAVRDGGGADPVPEPATLLLLGTGLAGLGIIRRRKRI